MLPGIFQRNGDLPHAPVLPGKLELLKPGWGNAGRCLKAGEQVTNLSRFADEILVKFER
jgi:hypothetical protein